MNEDKKIKVLNMIKSTLDTLPFSKFHLRILFGLGISWIIDGYEVTLLSVLSGILKEHLNMNDVEMAQAGSVYLLGCVCGAVVFAYLSNQYGRKKLFSTTLIIYMISILITADSITRLMFYLGRFMTGFSIGGEYTAIFAAIDELIPINYRGVTNILIDGTWHLGSIIACLASYYILGLFKNDKYNSFKDHRKLNHDLEIVWRSLFFIGFFVAIPILFIRKFIPESPRWLILKGENRKAIKELNYIRNIIKIDDTANLSESGNYSSFSDITIVEEDKISLIMRILFIKYPTRFIYALSLMISQAFFYNGIYYTFGLVLENYYKIEKEDYGIYMIPLSLANFMGPLLLGQFFDKWSRRKMITLCYLSSGMLLVISAICFIKNSLSLYQQIILWMIIFFIASPGASSAHLTVSEIFPTDIRSEALAIFFSIGLTIGGVISPIVFSSLINPNNRETFAISYYISAFLMIIAAIINFIYGVDTEKKSLEEIANSDEV